jgi:23S rRNA pseudouridine2604 synthase
MLGCVRMRLNKYIAKSGYCSRRKADTVIEDGRVKVNGHVATLGDDVDEDDMVVIDGKTELTLEGKDDIFIVFHKPVGVISTDAEDANNTVFDYVDVGTRLFYIGRLDVASSGLMLLTNNGDVAQAITKSKNGFEKEYIVDVDRKLTRSAIDALRDGVMILDRKTKPARVKKMKDTRIQMIITEGRNRQIRRMLEAVGYEVKKLKRKRIMHIELRDLGAGNWRHLSKKERRELLTITKTSQ